nr:MAG TPA: hypothetical protein [Caudoviricetes sp.]
MGDVSTLTKVQFFPRDKPGQAESYLAITHQP